MDPKRILLRCMSYYLCVNGTTYGKKSLKMLQEDPFPEKAQSGNHDLALAEAIPRRTVIGKAYPIITKADRAAVHDRPAAIQPLPGCSELV